MDKLEQKICDIIDSHKEEIIAFGRDIYEHAEMGYKEFRTAGKFVDVLKAHGLDAEEGLAVTGIKSYLKEKDAAKPTVAVIGELDALPITNHEFTNPETGAAHCCGHNAQMAGVVGAVMALTDPEVKEAMDGNIVFMATPAEEYVDLKFKSQLMQEGKIKYGGGKCELIRIGAFDDIDIAVGHHIFPNVEVGIYNCSSNGFVNKTIRYTGISSHAADAPHRGVDAYNAMAVALHAIDVQRESFQEKDTVRVHGFITHAGDAANVIADDVTLEYSVRAKYIPAYQDASKKVDRAFRAGAIATGAGLEIETMPGYMPIVPCEDVRSLKESLQEVSGGKYKISGWEADSHITGSTDFGDVSCIMPLMQFCTGGYEGQLHNPNIKVVDEYLAYVVTAKIFALTAYKLLKNGGDYAKAILDSFKATLTKEQYIELMDSMATTEKMEINQLPLV